MFDLVGPLRFLSRSGGFAMNAMLTKYLKDFSAPAPVIPIGSDMFADLTGGPMPDLHFEPEPQIDLDAERREAHDQGYSEAEAYFTSKQAEDLEMMKDAHAFQLQGLADAHESETIWMIHTRFHEMTEAISQSIAEQTLQTLLPVFDEEVCRRSIANLADLVRNALMEADVATVVVRGPERLYTRLQPLLDMDGEIGRAHV